MKGKTEKPEHNACSQCCFFDVDTKDNTDFVLEGETREMKRACRRFPVVVFKVANEWCGEWVKACLSG